MEQYILQDLLANTSLTEAQIKQQLSEIETCFQNNSYPSNELYSYLAKHHSNYLRSLYHKNVPVSDRGSFGRIESSNNTDDLLLSSLYLQQSSIYNQTSSSGVDSVSIIPSDFDTKSSDNLKSDEPTYKPEPSSYIPDAPTYRDDSPSYSSSHSPSSDSSSHSSSSYDSSSSSSSSYDSGSSSSSSYDSSSSSSSFDSSSY